MTKAQHDMISILYNVTAATVAFDARTVPDRRILGKLMNSGHAMRHECAGDVSWTLTAKGREYFVPFAKGEKVFK